FRELEAPAFERQACEAELLEHEKALFQEEVRVILTAVVGKVDGTEAEGALRGWRRRVSRQVHQAGVLRFQHHVEGIVFPLHRAPRHRGDEGIIIILGARWVEPVPELPAYPQ